MYFTVMHFKHLIMLSMIVFHLNSKIEFLRKCGWYVSRMQGEVPLLGHGCLDIGVLSVYGAY